MLEIAYIFVYRIRATNQKTPKSCNTKHTHFKASETENFTHQEVLAEEKH